MENLYHRTICLLKAILLISTVLLNHNVEAGQQSQIANGQGKSIEGTPNVLCLISHKFGVNTHFNIDNMRSYGWEPTLAGLTDTVQPCPWSDDYGNLPLAVDTLLTDIADINHWDIIAIMPANWWSPGGAFIDFLNDQHTLDLIHDANSSGKIIWATCAGVRVLAAADVIDGKNVTGKQNYQNEYTAAGATYLGPDIPPVIDGNIITSSKGMYFNTENIEAISTAFENLSGKQDGDRKHIIAKHHQCHDVNLRNETVIWSKTWGTAEAEGAATVRNAGQRKYFVSGYALTTEYMSDALNLWFDEQGNITMSSTGGGINNEYNLAACVNPDQSVVTAGYTASFGAGTKDMEITMLDPDGSMAWFNTFGGTEIDVAKSIERLSDGNFLVCGYTESMGTGENDIYLVKTWPNGQMIWEKTFGGPEAERGLRAIETADGNYVIVGETGSYGGGKKDVWLLKTDTQGRLIWSRTFGDQDYQSGHDVIETSDNKLLIIGSSDIHEEDFLNILIIKTDQDGTLIWQKQFGCPQDFYEYGMSVIETAEGNYLFASTVNNAVTRCNDAFVQIISPDGDELWSDTFGGEGSDRLVSVSQTDDNGYVLAGQTNSWGEGNYDAWVVKISNPITSSKEMNGLIRKQDILITPRVFKTSVAICFNTDSETTAMILDLQGVEVYSFGNLPPGCRCLRWNGKTNSGRMLAPGMYFFVLKDRFGKMQSSRIILTG